MSLLTSETIQNIVKEKLGDTAEVRVAFDGSKAHIIAVLAGFKEMSRLKKQQLIYGALADQIADGSIHAVTMETLTPEEWDKVKHFR